MPRGPYYFDPHPWRRRAVFAAVTVATYWISPMLFGLWVFVMWFTAMTLYNLRGGYFVTTSPYGHSEASVPPASTSRAPRSSTRRAWAATSSPPACSVQRTPHSPRIPCRMDVWPVKAA